MVKIGLVSADIFHWIQTRTNVGWTNVTYTHVDETNVSKAVDNSYRWPYWVWIRLVLYQLRYSIIFIQGQMLHGQMLTFQMSPRQLTTHADGLTIKPSKFGRVLTSNSLDMASFLLFNVKNQIRGHISIVTAQNSAKLWRLDG